MRTPRAVGMAFALAIIAVATHTHAAGFAKQSLFLSQETVSEGDTVFIYAVITNDTTKYFNGTLVFSDQDGPIGTTTIGLEADRASAYSTTWKPASGTHTVNANLLDQSGAVVESESSVFYINSKPKLADSSQTASASESTQAAADAVSSSTIASSQPIVNAISSISPATTKFTAPVFSGIDSGRVKAAASLSKGSSWSKQQIAKAALNSPGFSNTLWLILSTLALYACTVGLYMLGNIGVFYPVLALLFFFALWRSYRLVRR